MKLHLLLILSLALFQIVSSQTATDASTPAAEPAAPATPATPADPAAPAEADEPEEPAWTEVGNDELNNDTSIQGALTYGVGQVIPVGINNNYFLNADYDVVGIYSVLKQAGNGMNYRFEVLVNATTGTSSRRIKCDVNVPADGEQNLTRFAYGDPTNATQWTTLTVGAWTFLPKGVYVVNWTAVDNAGLNADTAAQNALTFGVGRTIQNAVNATAFPDSDYDVTGIYSVLKQVSSGTNYRFEVEVTNSEDLVQRVKCDVHAPPAGETGGLILQRFFYAASNDTAWTITEVGDWTFLPEGVYNKTATA